jgi:hypothetical protein
MRAVEIITVYLACAAPVGVARYLRCSDGVRGVRRIALAAAAGLLWPLTLLSHFTTRRNSARGITALRKNFPPRESAFERAERAVLEALHALEDEAHEACGFKHSGPTAEAARSTRATVERYTGLTLAARHARAGGEPTESELEPARVAGRTGDDLEVAGRCLHRRNVARLDAHRRSARVELLHALADLPDTFAASLLARPSDHAASRRLFAALLPVYSRAVELLRHDGDARGVQTLARLFDDACRRLRGLEAFDRRDAHTAPVGEEQCTPHDSQPTTPRLQPATPQLPSSRPHGATTLTRA